MTEIIHPFMTKEGNSEVNENSDPSETTNNENESSNLIDNNDISENNNKDIKDKFDKNIFFKKSLIYLSYALQLIIYLILLHIFFDKIDYIKITYNKLFDFALISIIFILLKHLQNIDDRKEMNLFLGLILSIISSISMYIFLYKLVIELKFKVIKDIMLMSILMYLYLSIISYLYSKKDISGESRKENKIILFSSWMVIILFCFIFNFFEIIKKEEVKFDLLIVLCLNIISITHIEIVVRRFNIQLRNYSMVHICLFIDIFLLSFFYYLFNFAELKKMKFE